MKYYIADGYGDYVGKGSYIVQGVPYKVVGKIEDARCFKTYEAAKNALYKMSQKYENVDDTYFVVDINYCNHIER